MKFLNFYYLLKPVIPGSIRQMLRRRLVSRLRSKSQGIWPILPGSEKAPAGWPGWPEGKKFAFVLSHDVEGEFGLAKCRKLMELEKRLGFRSSFNFIPEGGYRLGREMREELTREGFEVGVHDFRHDGKLYASQLKFTQQAGCINEYLKDWGAVGFRSGFMFHNLQWLQGLDIQYDASTFDTDPFEPQPDGAHTIFPFWVQGLTDRGYVEMPYTLAQDSTLYLFLQEKTNDIWVRKLAWLASHGGMALLNVHPDYIQFPGEEPRRNTFPAELYESFLRHVAGQYKNQYWHVLPKELAAWYKATMVAPKLAAASQAAVTPGAMAEAPAPAQPRKLRGRAAVVIYSYFETDSRPLRETAALVEAGLEVDVISLRRKGDPARIKINGANVYRISLQRRRRGFSTYTLQYAWFTLAAMTILAWRSLRKRYDLVHVHNMPDVLVFSALGPKLRGAKVILDLHDPMPELFKSKFDAGDKHLLWGVLRWMERCSMAFADLCLTPNLAFQRVFASRSCPGEKIKIVMNSPDTDVFNPKKIDSGPGAAHRNGEFVLMYHGLLVERHGLDLVIEAMVHLRSHIPGLRLDLYGEMTDYMEAVAKLVEKKGLQDLVHYHGFKPVQEIPKVIAGIDLGLVPNRLNEFTQINLPTRIFEYLCMDKPVIAPRTEGIKDYFKENEILFFQPGDAADLGSKILWAYQHPEEVQNILSKGRAIYEKNSWATEGGRFIGLVDDLLAGPAAK